MVVQNKVERLLTLSGDDPFAASARPSRCDPTRYTPPPTRCGPATRPVSLRVAPPTESQWICYVHVGSLDHDVATWANPSTDTTLKSNMAHRSTTQPLAQYHHGIRPCGIFRCWIKR